MQAIYFSRYSRWQVVGMIVYVLLMTSVLSIFLSGWAYDDPFITYRYAENLANGRGFVYNPGERILSTTTPLFTLVLVPLAFLGAHLPAYANLFGIFCLALGGLSLWDLSYSWKSPSVGWAGLIFYPTFPLLLITVGSETPIYLALCLATVAFYARGRYTLTAVSAGLATWARPDGALVAVVLGLDYLIRQRKPILWKTVAIYLAILLGWGIFAWAYFGSPVPVTLAAKQHQGIMAISQQFFAGFFTILGWYASWPYVVESALAVAGIVFALWKGRAWILFWLWSVLYFASYSILGVSSYFWYYTPLVPGFVVAVGLGIEAVSHLPPAFSRLFAEISKQTSDLSSQPSTVRKKSSGINGQWSGNSRLPSVLGVVLLGFLLIAQGWDVLTTKLDKDNRYAIYRAVGEWLNTNTIPEERVGALEVGIIGYFAQRPMVDFAGLIQPKIAQQLTSQTDYEDAAIWAVESYRPDYLVLHEGLFADLEEGYVKQSCVQVKTFPGSEYGYGYDLVVYHCSK